MKTFEKSEELKEQKETVSKKPQALSDDELEQVTGGNEQNDDNSGNKNCFTEIFMGGLTSPGDCAQCNLYDRCGNAGKLPIPQPLDTPLPTTDIIIKW